MLRIISSLCLICACAVGISRGQQDSARDGRRYVVIPPEQRLLAIASQPDCPLQFEEARLLMNMRGDTASSFQLRNQGTKPIRAYTLIVGGSIVEWTASDASQYILPGQRAAESEYRYEIVPLTEELRDRLGLRGPMQGLKIFMVTRVELTDGSVYNGQPAHRAMEEFFEDIFSRLGPRQETQRQTARPE